MTSYLTRYDRKAEYLSRVYGVDPRAIGIHDFKYWIVQQPIPIEKENGVEADDLCVCTEDERYGVEDEGARLLPNFRTCGPFDREFGGFTHYYFRPLDKECQGVPYCELPDTAEVGHPDPIKVTGKVVVRDGVRYLRLSCRIHGLRSQDGTEMPYDPRTRCYTLTGGLDGLYAETDAFGTYCICQKGHKKCLVTKCPDFVARTNREDGDDLDGEPYSCALCKKRDCTVKFNRPVIVTCKEPK